MLKALRNKSLKTRILRGFVLSASIAILVIFTPTPYQLQAPGQVENVRNIISINTETYPSTGAFLLPTVVSEPASLLYCIYSFVEPDAVLTSDEKSEPQAQSPGGGHQMALSQYLSTLVALDAVGYDVTQKFLGLRILKVDERSPNAQVLKSGDLLTGLDGLSLKSFLDFKKIVGSKSPGKTFPASITRGGAKRVLQLGVIEINGRTLIGVSLRPELEQTELPFGVSFKSGNTIGASGGLVFALEIYNQLTPIDLTKGRIIAATGTLDSIGKVGPIDGLEFKIKGARRAGAQIILIPKGNASEVQPAPEGIEVIAVGSFNEAIDALKR